jgi:hypothetical protein
MAGQEPLHDSGAALRSLLTIADRAVELQDRADAVLFACAAPGEPSGRVAREGGAVANQYHRLSEWARSVTPDVDPASLEGRIRTLVSAHCDLVHWAIRFAFPQHRTERSEAQRRAVHRLGRIAVDLRSARDELRMWVTLGGSQ